MLETARWTKFIAIVGFIVLGLFIFAGIGIGLGMSMIPAMQSELGAGFNFAMMIAYLIMVILYFFPTFYLYKYSRLIKPSILTGNQERFNLALSYQKKMFRFIGILIIITLAIYGLIFIGAIISTIATGV